MFKKEDTLEIDLGLHTYPTCNILISFLKVRQ